MLSNYFSQETRGALGRKYLWNLALDKFSLFFSLKEKTKTDHILLNTNTSNSPQ